VKITRKEIRRMLEAQVIKEQVEEAAPGPFLILRYGDDLEPDLFITKILPDDEWWFNPSDELDAGDMGVPLGYGLMEDRDRVLIFDMSKRTIRQFPGAPTSFIEFTSAIKTL